MADPAGDLAELLQDGELPDGVTVEQLAARGAQLMADLERSDARVAQLEAARRADLATVHCFSSFFPGPCAI